MVITDFSTIFIVIIIVITSIVISISITTIIELIFPFIAAKVAIIFSITSITTTIFKIKAWLTKGCLLYCFRGYHFKPFHSKVFKAFHHNWHFNHAW